MGLVRSIFFLPSVRLLFLCLVQAGLAPEPQLVDSAASAFEVRCEVNYRLLYHPYSFAVFMALVQVFVFPETNRFLSSSWLANISVLLLHSPVYAHVPELRT